MLVHPWLAASCGLLEQGWHRGCSSEIAVLVVPRQRLPVRLPQYIIRRLNGPTVQRVVVPAVLELLLDPPADLEPQLRRHGDVAAIEEAVDVAPEQQAIRDLVHATFGVGADMRSVERGEGALRVTAHRRS